ncbi:PDZ domain-containing protein [Armatimonas sp.]|uniref:PDZ domain-containing protein n=1 Tax=Armatimonas sp. TaxID=1872638 RepID=UPI00286CC61B|nr:PDZ domain-containing protein [Armatimonas sp.]
MRQVRWQADLDAAFTEALAQKKLLFVLFRCQREKRDAAILQPSDPKLIALLMEHYIPVRLISLKGVDLNRFRFDYDQQLMGLVLTPDGVTLARWGGDDVSVASLVAALERLKSVAWPKVGAVPASQTLRQKFPAFAQSKRAEEPCYHCHYAHDAEIEQQRKAGTFQKLSLFRYPPPSVLGLTLDDGNRIASVRPGSVAAKAGLKVGERLTVFNDQPIYTAADVAFALDALPAKVSRVVLNGKPAALPSGWRTYDISARPSQGAIPPIFGFWEEPVPGSKTLALKVNFVFPGEKWALSLGGLKLGDVIVAVDGKTLPQMAPRQFHTWLRLNKDVGQKLKLTVMRDGKRLILTLPCLDLRLD